MEEYIFNIDKRKRVKINNIQRIPQIKKKNRKTDKVHDRKLTSEEMLSESQKTSRPY